MKPVPIPGNPWRKCLTCSAPFAPTTEHHRYCCGRCRQQAYRVRHRRSKRCPGCGVYLHVGLPLAGGNTVSARLQHCSPACKMRVYRWRRDGRLMVCNNPQCPRHGFKHNHRYDEDNSMWECRGCGQLQPCSWAL